MDLAEAHAAALVWLAERPGWHVTNLGTGQGSSVLDMVAAFTKARSRAVPYRILLRREWCGCLLCRSWESPAGVGLRTRRDLSDMCASAWKFRNCDA
jgi:UDP-glucose 4-epimerase